jgi:cysteine desulfurase/selenocysteine lyase
VPWQQLAREKGVVLRFLPMTREGRLDLRHLRRDLTARCALVALTHCSNVTGAITDVAQVVGEARAVGAKVMLDGAQRAPHGPLDVQALDVDFYAFSGHKTFGPTGIGVLWGRREWLEAMPPFMTGGQMIDHVTLADATFRAPPRRFEAGTPPIAAAIGLGAALEWMKPLDWAAIQRHEMRLTAGLLEGLRKIPKLRVLGPLDLAERRGVVSFVVDGVSAEQICRYLDTRGVALRGGHHCAQPAMRAFGIDTSARASLAPYSTPEDLEALLDGLEALCKSKELSRS